MNLRFVLMLGIFLIVSGLSTSALELGSNYEKDCSQGICTINLYSYQKYYRNAGSWTLLNESFDTANCNGYAVCVDNNLHQFYLSSSSLIPSTAAIGGSFSIGLYSFAGITSFTKNLQVKGSVVTYKDILPGISLQYQYLAHEIKEMIIIDSQQSLLSSLPQGSNDLTILFQLDNSYTYSVSSQGASIQKNGNTITKILPIIIYDNETNRVGSYLYTVPTLSGQQYLQVTIPPLKSY